jgi:TDG/mug DNA glycosylase family protein
LPAAFVGTSVGDESHKSAANYANPSNAFWRLLNKPRLTPELLPAKECRRLLGFGLGPTDVTGVVSSSDAKLLADDYDRLPGRDHLSLSESGAVVGGPTSRVVLGGP